MILVHLSVSLKKKKRSNWSVHLKKKLFYTVVSKQKQAQWRAWGIKCTFKTEGSVKKTFLFFLPETVKGFSHNHFGLKKKRSARGAECYLVAFLSVKAHDKFSAN